MFQYLDLRSGSKQEQWSEMGGLLLGDSSQLNFTESPNVAKESTLFSILEENAPKKYYLSVRGAMGILRRVTKRGNNLPPEMLKALKSICQPQSTTPEETGMAEQPHASQETTTTGSQTTRSSWLNSTGDGIAATLDASYYKGNGARNGKEREFVAREEGGRYMIRRLTPNECLRLQGLPEWWCDGADGSDTAIYKMAGNGIAVPCAVDIMSRIVSEGE